MSTLDNLRKDAKRWLKALRNGDPSARQRLRLAHPSAPADPGLRDIQHALARERGHAHWRALKAAAIERDAAATAATPERSADDSLVSDFLQFACWDHHVHGRGDYAAAEASAMRLLTRHPELATANLYTAIVCGELETAQHIIDGRAAARRREGRTTRMGTAALSLLRATPDRGAARSIARDGGRATRSGRQPQRVLHGR